MIDEMNRAYRGIKASTPSVHFIIPFHSTHHSFHFNLIPFQPSKEPSSVVKDPRLEASKKIEQALKEAGGAGPVSTKKKNSDSDSDLGGRVGDPSDS